VKNASSGPAVGSAQQAIDRKGLGGGEGDLGVVGDALELRDDGGGAISVGGELVAVNVGGELLVAINVGGELLIMAGRD
jgi:hypothetical protein